MTSNASNRYRLLIGALFVALLVCGAAYLFQRSAGLNPTVFADEWYYSKFSRLTPLAESWLPSFLYLWIFSASQACGDGFLDCVRAGNVALYVGAVPFIYLIARKYTVQWMAWLVSILTLLAPLNIYTAYFMPEATYFFGFFVLSWIALVRTDWHWALLALATGVVLGMMSLVKVHALFLIPALSLYLLYATWLRGGRWLVPGVSAALLAAGVTIGVKYGLGYLLAGDAGLHLLGQFYQGAVNDSGAGSRLALLMPAYISGRGHLMALAVVLALPLAVLLHGVFGKALRDRAAAVNPLHMYTFLMLGAAAGLTIIYTATLVKLGEVEITRLHLRYYSFVFPLMWIVGAAAIKDDKQERSALRWGIAAVLALLLALALVLLPTYWTNVIDGPDIGGIRLDEPLGWSVVAVQAVLLLLWPMRKQIAIALFVVGGLPWVLLVAQQPVNLYLEAHRADGAADRAGKMVHKVVPATEHGKVLVAADDMSLIMRMQFHIDHPDTTQLLINKDTRFTEENLPVEQKWMVILGQHQLPASPTIVHQDPQFTLLRLAEPDPLFAHVALAQPVDTSTVPSVEGLSVAEAGGRWSDSKQVVIHFAQPLPRKFQLVLNARAYGPNTEHPFKIRVGDSQDAKEVRLGWERSSTRVAFDTDGQARSVTIEVPHPTSPAERGESADARKLGIFLSDLYIRAPAATLATK